MITRDDLRHAVLALIFGIIVVPMLLVSYWIPDNSPVWQGVGIVGLTWFFATGAFGHARKIGRDD